MSIAHLILLINYYNYMNKILNKWTDTYDNAKRMQQIRWSENDVLAKAHE